MARWKFDFVIRFRTKGSVARWKFDFVIKIWIKDSTRWIVLRIQSKSVEKGKLNLCRVLTNSRFVHVLKISFFSLNEHVHWYFFCVSGCYLTCYIREVLNSAYMTYVFVQNWKNCSNSWAFYNSSCWDSNGCIDNFKQIYQCLALQTIG